MLTSHKINAIHLTLFGIVIWNPEFFMKYAWWPVVIILYGGIIRVFYYVAYEKWRRKYDYKPYLREKRGRVRRLICDGA